VFVTAASGCLSAVRGRASPEAAFLQIGTGAETWLIKAAAGGTAR
jgi:hypothetical protein